MKPEIQALIQALEYCIDRAACNFQKLPFNFHNERDIQSCLFGYLRAEEKFRMPYKDSGVELVHAEFPVLWKNDKVRGKYDLVIWKPQSAKRMLDHWGESHSEHARNIPLLIAVEVKYLYGGVGQLKRLSSYSKVMRHNDIRKLVKGRNQYCYFLAFHDEDVKDTEDYRRCLQDMRLGFEKAREKIGSRLRVLYISRDNYKIRLGFSAD